MEFIRSSLQPENSVKLSFLWFGHNLKTVILTFSEMYKMFFQGEGLALYKEYINDFPSIINSMNQWFSQSPHFKSLMGVS